MKKLVLITGLIYVLLISCKKEDNSLGYYFKDQNLCGKFNNKDWNMQSGRASLSLINNDTAISVTCYGFASDNPCAENPSSGNEVNFTLPKKAGIYNLYVGSKGTSNSRYIYFIERSGTGNNGSWKYVYDGAVEIISISNTEVKGRITATYIDSVYFVNGNFALKLCSVIKI